MWWNFVASSRGCIEEAKRQWRAQNRGAGLFDSPPGIVRSISPCLISWDPPTSIAAAPEPNKFTSEVCQEQYGTVTPPTLECLADRDEK
ncbi:hypothetical protein [Aquisalimonas sp.]|uniref:hypothetical protein n=1 Tax=Aquisalimonas sp. TaxID=1872621 RepID=UPI0025C72D81|nr:hypothetical protein [Aquisalimonas sp.]